MNPAVDVRGVLVGMTGQAKLSGCCRDELHASRVFRDADFVAAGAANRDRAVNVRTLALVLVAFEAFGRISFRVQRHGVLACRQA